jgi:hypothetical protein
MELHRQKDGQDSFPFLRPVSTLDEPIKCETRFQAFAFKWVNLHRYTLVKRLSLECSTETHGSINRHIFFHRTFYTFVVMCEAGLRTR